MSRRVPPLLALLLVLVALKLGQQLYEWVAFRDERAQVVVLRRQLVDAGAEIVRRRQESDSMRAVLRGEDDRLESEQRSLRRYNRYVHDSGLPPDLYVKYREDLSRYNEHVDVRNARLSDWREIVSRYNAAVERYNSLSDSVRGLALRMGEPYYAVPTPAEAAVERGLIKPQMP